MNRRQVYADQVEALAGNRTKIAYSVQTKQVISREEKGTRFRVLTH